ncbi:MAG TPA: type VII secretion-associated serine protease mycosin [Micromonosporaceae bacterium]
MIWTALLSVVGSAAALAVPAAAVAAPAGVLATRPGAVAAPLGPLPNQYDSFRDDQWQLRELDAEAAWRLSTGKGVIVAVVDSGVDASHSDLVGQVLPGIDLVRRSGDGRVDPVGHGTSVAAFIAGRGDDDKGVVGLAPRAKILPIRVLDEKNTYHDTLVVANAVRWAVDHGARVINLSLGGGDYSPALAAALDYAFVRDVVVVACTGNRPKSTPDQVWYPAREPGVLAVAGLERDTDELWAGSVTGTQTALAAPATGLIGAKPGGYWLVQGTSFAAPMVTATAALIRSRWPDMSAADVVNRLIRTARDLGPAGRDDLFGFGRIDPVGALTASVGTVSSNPLDDGAAPGTAGFGRAPQLAGATTPAAVQPGRLAGRAESGNATWAARPAGSPAERSPAGGWDEGALLLVVLAGGTVLVRRVGRGFFPRPGPSRRGSSTQRRHRPG